MISLFSLQEIQRPLLLLLLLLLLLVVGILFRLPRSFARFVLVFEMQHSIMTNIDAITT